VAERYAIKDSRIRVLSTDRLLDVMGSQNTAFRQMVDLSETHPPVGIVGAYRLGWSGEGTPPGSLDTHERSERALSGDTPQYR
jgi:hypothetical protein